MSQRRVVETSTSRVWDVLADGWMYPVFVVGAARMREVDDAWPAQGSELHHSAGMWPLMIDDTTTVERCEVGRLLVLTARGWPAGQARITMRLTPLGPERTEVVIEEDATRGMALAVPGPLRRCAMDLRNTETLHRLDLIARGREPIGGGAGGAAALG